MKPSDELVGYSRDGVQNPLVNELNDDKSQVIVTSAVL